MLDLITNITKERLCEALSNALSRVSPKEASAKLITSERNVYNWRGGTAEPSAHQLVRLMAAYPDIYDAVTFMAGRRAVDASLSTQQIAAIHEALSLIGTAIPAAYSQQKEDALCRQSSFQTIAGTAFHSFATPRLATQ